MFCRSGTTQSHPIGEVVFAAALSRCREPQLMCFGRQWVLEWREESGGLGMQRGWKRTSLPFFESTMEEEGCFEHSGSLTCIVKIPLTQTFPIARSITPGAPVAKLRASLMELAYPVVRTCAGRTAIRSFSPIWNCGQRNGSCPVSCL